MPQHSQKSFLLFKCCRLLFFSFFLSPKIKLSPSPTGRRKSKHISNEEAEKFFPGWLDLQCFVKMGFLVMVLVKWLRVPTPSDTCAWVGSSRV